MPIEGLLTRADWSRRCGELRGFGTVADIEGLERRPEHWQVRLATWTTEAHHVKRLEDLVFESRWTEGHLTLDITSYLALSFSGRGRFLAEISSTTGAVADTLLLADAYAIIGPQLGNLLSQLDSPPGRAAGLL